MKGDIEEIVTRAIRSRTAREKEYRAMSLKMHPWICARCSREFNERNLHGLTVHHKDHNHENNPKDGSNWEHLCIYCHDNEHARYVDNYSCSSIPTSPNAVVRHKALANLGAEIMKRKEDKKTNEVSD